MTTSLKWLAMQNADTAVIKGIHDQIIAVGMVQTSDTGQLDLTSNPTYSTTDNFNYGYTIYRFNDAAQSTMPIYFKISWTNRASSGGNNKTFSMTITFGTGSNGTGTITGGIGPATTLIQTGSGVNAGTSGASTTLYPSYVCSDGSSLGIFAGMSNTFAGLGLMVDRFRDSSGAALTTGWWWNAMTSLTAVTGAIHTTNTGPTSSPGTWSAVGSNPTGMFPCLNGWSFPIGSQSASGVIPIFPGVWMAPDAQNVLIGVGVTVQDIGYGSIFQAVHLGATHTFINVSTSAVVATPGVGHGANTGALAMLWE